MQWNDVMPGLERAGWAVARVSGLFLTAPFLGTDAVPAKMKAAFTVLLCALLWPVYHGAVAAKDGWQWVAAACGEFGVGLVLGVMANLLFEGALLAGQVLSVPTGYSLVNVIDPQSQVDTPVLSELHQMAALAIFLGLNLHHWLLRALAASFRVLPAGAAVTVFASGPFFLRAAGSMFVSGVQVAAPALAATLLVDVLLGFLAKTSPQLPVLFFGLSIKNLLALAVLLAMVGFWPARFTHLLEENLHVAGELLRAAPRLP